MNYDEIIYYKQISPKIFWIQSLLIIFFPTMLIIYFSIFIFTDEIFSQIKVFDNFSVYNLIMSCFILSQILSIVLFQKILKRRAYLKLNPVLLGLNKKDFYYSDYGYVNWSDIESFQIKTKAISRKKRITYLAINVSPNIDLGEEKTFLGLIKKKKTSIDICDQYSNIELPELVQKLENYKRLSQS